MIKNLSVIRFLFTTRLVLSFQTTALLFMWLCTRATVGQAQALVQSKPDLFTYYDANAPGMPPGSDVVSKGVVYFSSYSSALNDYRGAEGTAFLIRTFRDDNKVCMCLTGHQIAPLYQTGLPVLGNAVHLNTDIYMDYLGKDTLVDDEHRNYTLRFSKSFIGAVTLLEYSYAPDPNGYTNDAALVLVDKRYLPSTLFSTMGYDFRDEDWTTGAYYTIAHPFGYPQRIADHLTYVAGRDLSVTLGTVLPYAVANRTSGAPLLTRPSGSDETSVARGILTNGENQSTFQASYKSNPSRMVTLKYSLTPRFAKIKLLEAAIRKHCLKTKDSAFIATNGSYRQTVTVDNSTTVGRYSRNYEVKSSASLTDAAVFTESTSDVEITRLNANNCTIGSFTLPVVFADNGKPWQVAVAAKQIDVGADFNYAASDASELELSTVVIGAALSSVIRQADDAASVKNINRDENGFNVYPNPSQDGTFDISLPATGQYRLEIHSIDGKKIYAASCTCNPFQFALSAVSHGNYFLTVFSKERNKLVYGKMIVY